ncbi:MAG: hypothetical protein ACI3Y5_02080 [Prevotella sp.]
MNRIIQMMVIAIAMVLSSTSVSAQNDKSQRLNREALAERQARHIASQMALDDATTQKYVTTYCAYQKELWGMGPRMKRQKKAEMTEEEAKQANKARLERSRKMLDLREKYYQEYSTFLTQKQIERAYQLEQQMMQRLARKHNTPKAANAKGQRRPAPNQKK